VRVQVARKQGHAPEWHEWSTAVVATDAAAQDGRAHPTNATTAALNAGGRVDPGALDLLKPRTKRLVMGPVLVCVRADLSATHVLIRYRPTY
jgi:hypothetical protein